MKSALNQHQQSIHQVFDMIRRGDLRVPELGQEFSWSSDDQLALFESIRRGLPIGPITCWRPCENEEVKHLSLIDKPTNAGHFPSYVIDGYNRILTLFGQISSSSDLPKNVVRIGYNFNDNQFVMMDISHSGIDYILPVKKLFDSIELLRFQREIKNPNWVTKSDELAEQTRILVVQVTTIVSSDKTLINHYLKTANQSRSSVKTIL